MATGLSPALRVLTSAVVGRMRYLGLSGRLTEESRRELEGLEAELQILRVTMRDIDRQGALPQHTHSALVRAYRRELARYRALVSADNRVVRERSARIRQAAQQTAEASRRVQMKMRLRVLPNRVQAVPRGGGEREAAHGN